MQAVTSLRGYSLAGDEEIPDLPIEQESSLDKPQVMKASR